MANKWKDLFSRFAKDAAELEGEPGEGGELEHHTHIHLPGTTGSDPANPEEDARRHDTARRRHRFTDDPESAIEDIVQRMSAMEQQHEEMMGDLDMLLEESEAGEGEQDARRWGDDRRDRRSDDARGKRLDDARRRHEDRRKRRSEDTRRHREDDARRRHEDARRHIADMRRRHEDVRKRLEDARGHMDAEAYGECDARWKRLDDDMRRAHDQPAMAHGTSAGGASAPPDYDSKRLEEDARRLEEDVRRHHDSEEAGNEKIEGNLELEAPPGTGDKARRAHDSVYLEDSHREACSLAEIIRPGIRLPTFDRSAKPRATFDSICDLRRRTVEDAYRDAEMKKIIDALSANRFEVGKMTCDAIRPIFVGLGMQRRAANNRGGSPSYVPATAIGGRPVTNEDLNKMYAEHWAKSGMPH